MKNRLTNKVFVILSLFFIFFQTFSIPILAAVKPWTGNPWTGNPWQGEPIDHSDMNWEGDPWQGTPWEGGKFTGKEWDGNTTDDGSGWDGVNWDHTPWYLDPWIMNGWSPNGFTGYGTTGIPFSGDSFTGTGTNGEAFSGNAFNGNGTIGNPFAGQSFNGSGTSGSPFAGNNFNGSGTNGTPFNGLGTSGNPFAGNSMTGDPFLGSLFNGDSTQLYPPYSPLALAYSSGWEGSGTEQPGDVKLPKGYEIAKYITNDLIGGQVSMVGEFLADQDNFRPSGSFFSTLMLNGVKVGLGEKTPWFINGLSDTSDFISKSIEGVNAAKTYRDVRQAGTIAAEAYSNVQSISNITETAGAVSSSFGVLSKFNVATAALGAGYSAFELGFNGTKAYDVLTSNAAGNEKVSAVAEATGNLGDLILNAGVITAAIPGGQAAGAIMIAGGAALWGASKLTKVVADNWKSISKFTKNAVSKTKAAIGNGWKKLTGIFG